MKPSDRRVALVTGSGRRLGRAIALRLHSAGFSVVAHHHRSEKGAGEIVARIRSEGGEAVSVRADLTRVADIRRLFRETSRRFGRLDLLVNSAAIFVRSTAERTTEKIWDATLDTNLKGMFFCSQEAARMMKRRGGMIINIASLGGLQAWSGHLAYSVSKAGVIMLTRALARSLAPRIRVNAIAPGTIIMPGEETGLKHVPRNSIPLRAYGEAADVTNMVVFLATEAPYVTGQVFPVDGGRSIP